MSIEDSIELNEEEVDVLSLLATESEEEVDEDDDGSEAPDTLEAALEAIETLKGRVSKRNKSLKMAKGAQHRTQDELNTLLGRFDQLENRIQNQPATDTGQEKLEQEAQAWRDRVEDDPTQVTGMVDWKLGQLEDRLARFLDTKLGGIESKMSEWQGQTNPERQKYAQQMEAVRQLDGMADATDETLLAVAKALGGKKVKNPRGTVGGQRGSSEAPDPNKLSDKDRELIREAVRAGM